ncbi:hypothetical protein FACS189499_08300 [Clostridia bacterium]|nr:hypothetical protein FACS189499_08300 [Clostridia bacterium]
MWALYKLVNNFGWAVIIFTLIIKAVTFPLTLKQQKNMAVSQIYTPRVQEIQTKYRDNKQKQQEEMMKLQSEGYNPVGGCGPMIVIMLILFGMIDVVYKPMTHFEHFEKPDIVAIKEIALEVDYTAALLSSPEDTALVTEFMSAGDGSVYTTDAEHPEIVLTEYTPDKHMRISEAQKNEYGKFIEAHYNELSAKDSRISKQLKNQLKAVNTNYLRTQGELFALRTFEVSPDAFRAELKPELFAATEVLQKNMYFYSMNLGETPTVGFNLLLLIPIFSFLSRVFRNKNNLT